MGTLENTRQKTTMSFPGAMQRVIDGGKVTKLEWNDPAIFISLRRGFLSITKKDGTVSTLLVSENDMIGNDWVSVVDV